MQTDDRVIDAKTLRTRGVGWLPAERFTFDASGKSDSQQQPFCAAARNVLLLLLTLLHGTHAQQHAAVGRVRRGAARGQ